MAKTKKWAFALLRSSHPIPCLAVASFGAIFAFGNGMSLARSAVVFLAVLLQQISVGLSNDWLDAERDKTAGRADKPTVNGLVKVSQLRAGALFAAGLAELVGFMLGAGPAITMALMLIFGWSYNLGMKNNWSSAIPYALGFCSVPVFIGLAAQKPYWVPVWLVAVTALLGVSAHFANVLPDMIADKLTGVNALPHILGQRLSALTIAGTALAAALLTVSQSPRLNPAVGATGLAITVVLVGFASALSLRTNPPRAVFPLLILAALANVVLLVLGAAK
jgi:4-hydroxybenzoate polyprenyltransferase